VGSVHPEPADRKGIKGRSAGILVNSKVVVGGVGLDVHEESPDEPPDNIDGVDDSDPKLGIGPVPPVIGGPLVDLSSFGGY